MGKPDRESSNPTRILKKDNATWWTYLLYRVMPWRKTAVTHCDANFPSEVDGSTSQPALQTALSNCLQFSSAAPFCICPVFFFGLFPPFLKLSFYYLKSSRPFFLIIFDTWYFILHYLEYWKHKLCKNLESLNSFNAFYFATKLFILLLLLISALRSESTSPGFNLLLRNNGSSGSFQVFQAPSHVN